MMEGLDTHENWSAVVLAAGASNRMGAANKLLLPFDGKPMVAGVVEEVLKAAPSELIVVVGHEKEAVRAALSTYPVTIVENLEHQKGMGKSLAVGIEATSSDSAGYLVMLGDLPWMQAHDIQRVVSAFGNARLSRPHVIVRTNQAGRPGHPVLFSASHRKALMELDGDVGAKSLIRDQTNHLLEVMVEGRGGWQDVDTPQTYRKGVED